MGYTQQKQRRRTALILVIIVLLFLAVGGGIAFLVINQPQLVGGGDNSPQAVGDAATPLPDAPTPAPSTLIVVAARDIPRGARVELDDLRVAPYPVTEELPLPSGAIEISTDETMAGLSEIVGQVARSDIITDQPIFSFQLADPADTVDLADMGSDTALSIPPGLVAIAIPIDRFSGVGYALRPGDKIDIIMSMMVVDIDEDFQTLLPNDEILLVYDAETNTLTTTQYPAGRESLEESPLGGDDSTILEVPSEDRQRPRRGSQLMVDNALVLNVGEYDVVDLYQPIVITPEPEPVTDEEGEETAEGEGDGSAETVGDQLEEGDGAEATPAPPIRLPDMIIIAIPRQDAVVLDFALNSGLDMNVALRSAFDDDIEDVTSDTVTLDYLLETYGFTEPPNIDLGIAGQDSNLPEPSEPADQQNEDGN